MEDIIDLTKYYLNNNTYVELPAHARARERLITELDIYNQLSQTHYGYTATLLRMVRSQTNLTRPEMDEDRIFYDIFIDPCGNRVLCRSFYVRDFGQIKLYYDCVQ